MQSFEKLIAAAAVLVPKKSGFIFPLTSTSSLLMNNGSFHSHFILLSLIRGAACCQLGLLELYF